MVSTLLHYNPKLPHQVRHAKAFARAGVPGAPSPEGDADVHIVSGPHFALERWRGHSNLILLDRAFYGDPEYVCLGWLNPDGSRTFAYGSEARYRPGMMPWKRREDSALILADFNQKVDEIRLAALQRFGYVRVRRHPAEKRPKFSAQVSLAADLALSDVCIGCSSTALFEAVVLGVPVICLDPSNPVAEVSAGSIEAPLYRGDREAWLHRISYMQWNHDEFGRAVEKLLAQRSF